MHADVLKVGQTKPIYNKLGDAFSKIRGDEGTRGLWQGLTFSFLALVPQVMGSLAFYEWHINATKNGEESMLNSISAPIVASIGGSLLFYPLETIR